MTSGGNHFNDFPEIAPTRESATKIEKTFLVFSSVAMGLFPEWAQCCGINSNDLHPALTISCCRSRTSACNTMKRRNVNKLKIFD